MLSVEIILKKGGKGRFEGVKECGIKEGCLEVFSSRKRKIFSIDLKDLEAVNVLVMGGRLQGQGVCSPDYALNMEKIRQNCEELKNNM